MSGSPITYSSYGTGEKPIITGFTTVSAWTNIGGNIWESTNAVSTLSTCNMVIINGVNAPMGRYPNADAANGGYLTFQSHSGTTSITSSSLSGTHNWTGAELVIRLNRWTIDIMPITGQSGGTLTYGGGAKYEPTNAYGFFIQNDAGTLDQQNEWYYNPTTKKISIYSTSEPTNVQVPTVSTLVTLHSDYVTFDGITVEGANDYCFENQWDNMNNITIQNCSIQYAGIDALSIANITYFTVTNNVISDANSCGVDCYTTTPNATITYNVISNIGIYAGMGKDGGFFNNMMAIRHVSSANGTIQHNTITNVGYVGICFWGSNSVVEYNVIDTFCTVLDDGSGIYNFGNTYTGQEINNNIVLNGIGNPDGTNSSDFATYGIYLDDDARNVSVTNNTVANCSDGGIFLHNASYITLTGNTVYNCAREQLLTSDNSAYDNITNCIINNNIFVAKSASQNIAMLLTSGSGLIEDIGAFDSNYYARPIDDTDVFYVRPNGWDTPDYHYTLSEWQTYSGQDANSTGSPYTITMKVNYN